MPVPDPENELSIGIKVRLVATGEVGIVVWTWHDEFLDSQDCYVAFFGDHFPSAKPSKIPYILRYLSTSLERIDS